MPGRIPGILYLQSWCWPKAEAIWPRCSSAMAKCPLLLSLSASLLEMGLRIGLKKSDGKEAVVR